MFKYRSATKTFRVICIYFFICLLTELISIPLSINKINNALLGDIFYIIEGLLLIGFYYLSYREKEFLGPAILIAVAYFLYGLYSTIIDPGPWIYNANFRAGESLMVQMLSAYSLIRISKEEDIQPLNHPGFWISTGFFIYFFVNISVFITGTVLFEDNNQLMKSTWFIHSYTNMLVNVIFAYGLFCIPTLKHK